MKLKQRRIVFSKANQVDFLEEETSVEIPSDGVLLRRKYSVISPGTELACLGGGESWFKFPGSPGYISVSEVLECGDEVTAFSKGELVFHYGKHLEYEVVKPSGIFLRIPQGLDPKLAGFTRMATIAMTAVRVSTIELGDDVVVTGQGLIGLFATQLANIQGGNVIAIDISEKRLAQARELGAVHCINPLREDVSATIQKITDGKGVSTLIEATGVPKMFVDSLPWVGKRGEAILLGTPRGEFNTDITPVLGYSHLWPKGCITFKGAHEWRYPLLHDDNCKHSIERNSKVVMQMIASGRIQISPLITHVLSPGKAGEAYTGLKKDKENYLGVVFDWSL